MGQSATSTRVILGALLIAVGALLLLETTGVIEVGSLLRWLPSAFIVFGLWRLVANRFRRIAGPIFIIVVAAFVQLWVLGIDAMIIWPALIIAVGVAILFGWGRARRADRDDVAFAPDAPETADGGLSVTAICGSSRRRVSAGEFRGGEVTVIMGEAHIDLRDVDASELPGAIDVDCVMGQVKLKIPSDWNARIDNSTVMGESKDERNVERPADGADLTITGFVMMGSLEIED